MSYSTYAITIRPTDGITDEQISAVDVWLAKSCDHYVAITEKTGKDRHLHAALYLKKSTTRSNLNNRILALKGLDGTLSANEKAVLRKGTRIMYNDDFAKNYLTKGDDTKPIGSDMPEDNDDEGWEALQALYPEKDDDRAKKKFEGSKWYFEQEKAFHSDDYAGEWYTAKVAAPEIAAFLHQRMYVGRRIEVISDPRVLNQKIVALTKFIESKPIPSPYALTAQPMEQENIVLEPINLRPC